MSAIREAFLFLIKIVFELYFLIVLIRFMFEYFKVQTSTLPPIVPYIYKVTDPLIQPLQKFLPTHKGIPLATGVLLFLIKAIEFLFIILLMKGGVPSLIALLIWPIGELFSQTLNFFCIAVIVVAIASWFMPNQYSPFSALLIQITDIVLKPARRIIPPLAGFDLSPIAVLIVLKFIDLLIAVPLIRIGFSLA